jgi:hypothetical protein
MQFIFSIYEFIFVSNSAETVSKYTIAYVPTAIMASEEEKFFSVGGTDRTLRCWDQRDLSQSYQFLIPGIDVYRYVYCIYV